MKKIVLALLIVLPFFFAKAQDTEPEEKEIKTLFGSEGVVHGAYGALTIHYGEVFEKNSILIGARGAWTINHWISFGLGGYGLVTGHYFDDIDPQKRLQLGMGYGGLIIEPTIAPVQPVHLSFPFLIGMGGAVFFDDTYDFDYDNSDWNRHHVDDDAFFVVEPGVNLEINVLKFFRLGFEAKYRFIDGLELIGSKNSDFEGISYGMIFKFGKF